MSRRRWLLIIGTVSLLLFSGLGLAVHWHGRPPSNDENNAANTTSESSEEPQALTLSEEERKFLWQVEHHGNLLSRHGFRALGEALRRADRDGLTALLAEDFTGHVARKPREVRLENDIVRIMRHDAAGTNLQPLDRTQFAARLLDFRRLFPQPPRVKLALMGLTPTVRDDLDSAWQGSCQLRLWGEAAPGKPAEVMLYLQYRTPRPTENALHAKGWLRSCTLVQSQQAQATRPLFREATAERGLDARRFFDNWSCEGGQPITGGVYLCDFDRDGFLDLLVTDVKGCVLWRGRPEGKFEDVTRKAGLPAPAPTTEFLAAFADLDGDGWEDLILGNHVYRNDKGRRFRDVTWLSNLSLPADATGIALADFDRDGRIDLYVTRGGKAKKDSWVEGRSGQDGNYLLRNLGKWHFRDVTVASGAGGDHRSTFSAAWFDADNDGWPDLYVPNEFGNGVLLVNEGNGHFREQLLIEGANDFGTMGVTCGDIDNDGRIDLYAANMYSKAGNRIIGNLRPDTYAPEVMARLRSLVAGSQLYLNRDGRRFDPVGSKYQVAAVGWAYGAALVDLDNDGWLDLYATCGYVSRSRSEPDG